MLKTSVLLACVTLIPCFTFVACSVKTRPGLYKRMEEELLRDPDPFYTKLVKSRWLSLSKERKTPEDSAFIQPTLITESESKAVNKWNAEPHTNAASKKQDHSRSSKGNNFLTKLIGKRWREEVEKRISSKVNSRSAVNARCDGMSSCWVNNLGQALLASSSSGGTDVGMDGPGRK